jgi:tRNA(fMet)-specific endonuclease VapC
VKFLLDTSTCIRHLRGTSPAISARLQHAGPDAVLCAIVVHELFFGVERSKYATRELALVEQFRRAYISLPLDDRIAIEAARLRAALASVGTPIGPYDLLIAATAAIHNLTVITCNTGEFGRIPGLVVQDWQTA